jgi:hypothetical protein
MRTLSHLDTFLATTDDGGVQLHLYADSEVTAAVGGGQVRLSVATEYPWDGVVRVRVDATPGSEWTLSLRVPAWARGTELRAGAEKQDVTPGSYATVRRAWRAGEVVELVLPMEVRFTAADERIDAVRGCVAIERGPLVYAVEQVDQPREVVVDDLHLDATGTATAEHHPDLLEGVTVVRARGRAGPHSGAAWPYGADAGAGDAGNEVPVTAVPYFAWANRGIGPMRVWLPRA